MTLENAIKSVLEQKMTDGTIEKLVAEKFEQGIGSALDNMFRSYGDITKVIEEKLKDVMVPYIEKHDFNRYLVKLDMVLTELSNSAILENKKMLDNFKTLMEPAPEKIKASELFEKWMEYAAETIETDGLEVEFDDEPSYEYSDVSFEFEQNEKRSWSSFEYGELIFESEHDEELNISIPVSKWNREDYWTIGSLKSIEIKSLRNANEFQVFLHALSQGYTRIYIDTTYETESITPNAKPEASWD